MRPLGSTGIRVSELCLGTMTFGREIDETASAQILDQYLDAGGNFVDTADVYATGGSEEILGRLLAGKRDEIVLATKFRMQLGPGRGGASRRWIRIAIEDSLRRLQTDHVDLYQIHCWDEATPIDETLSTLDDLVHEGKVRYLGASNFAGWQLAKALGRAELARWEPFVSIQPQYALNCRDIEREVLPLAEAEGLAVLPWSPLGGGLLTGKYRRGEQPDEGTRARDRTPSSILIRQRLEEDRVFELVDAVARVADATGKSRAQVALNWVLHRPGVTAPILGARTVDQIDDNLGAAGWQLDPEHRTELDQASAVPLGYPHDFIWWINAAR